MWIRRLAVAAALLLLGGAASSTAAQDDLATVLSFEGAGLGGWMGGPPTTLSKDSTTVRQGRYAGRINRVAGEAQDEFSAFAYRIPRDFAGERIVLRGWLRTEDVSGFAGLWLRQDGPAGAVQFDNMQGRGPSGTTEWAEYRIDLPLDDDARAVVFGALLAGDGTLWVDDLQLTVDGLPVWEAPPYTPAVSPAELDVEFEHGSGIATFEPSASETERLGLLGRVWGFVKYHHPRVRDGEVNWDYELFRVLPAVLAAPDRDRALDAIAAWLDELGMPDACDPCAEPTPAPQLEPDVGWIRDRELLGDRLGAQLETIHARRPGSIDHYYVELAPNVGNPGFANEAPYARWELPDAGYRLLALYRYWNIIEYWFPYRDLIDGDWEAVLAEFTPRVASAQSADAYRMAMMELIARIDDTHANLVSHRGLQPPRGTAQVPVVVRFIEGQAVVTGYSHPELGPATGLGVGDVIEAIDGREVASLVAEWAPYYSASNEPTRLRYMALNLLRGGPGEVGIAGSRVDGAFEVQTARVPLETLDGSAGSTHDLPGPAFQRLSDEVAYLKLSAVVSADIPTYLASAEGADVLVIDIRNYPNEFVVFSLGGHLVTEPTEHARFSVADATNPGAFWMRPPIAIQPLAPYFPGDVAILVDETSLSQAEYTAMALRVGPTAIVVGSTTAGADGNISPFALPGGLRTLISGIGVFYPDGTPTQRIGIVSDLEVRPTISGIREGRDEVLEAAVSRLLGRTWRLTR